MSNFECYLDLYESPNAFEKNGMVFVNAAIIQIEIDHQNIFDLDHFDDALVVADELYKSTLCSGRYLILTSLNGIAEEGGWEGIEVSHGEEDVLWRFEVGNAIYKYLFLKEKYTSQVNLLKSMIEGLNPAIVLEPSSVLFPFNWSNELTSTERKQETRNDHAKQRLL